MAGQPATIEIIKDPYKDDFDDFIVDLSNNIRERFFVSLNNNETNIVIIGVNTLGSNALGIHYMDSGRTLAK